MKKIIAISFLCVCLTANIFAQDVANNEELFYKNEIKLGFLQLYDATFLISYEYMLNKSNSLSILESATIKEKDFYHVFELHSELQYRHYFILQDRTSTKLLYIGTYLMHKYREETNKNYNLKSFSYVTDNYTFDNILGFGTIGGIKLEIFKRLYVDFYIGGGVKISNSNKSATYETDRKTVFSPHYSGFAPKANLMFGFSF